MAFAIFCAVFFVEFLIFLFGVYFEAKGKKAQLCALRMQKTAVSQQNSAVHTKKQRRLFYLAHYHRKTRVRKKNLKRLKGVIT